MKKLISLLSAVVLAASSCAVFAEEAAPPDSLPKKEIAPLVTFIELGSVGCIPCVKMQPIMKAIEKKYGDQVKVIFYDVRRPENKQYAVEYRVQAIPTQVFLDAKGASFFRHMGFFPEEEIDKILQKKGLKPIEATEEKS